MSKLLSFKKIIKKHWILLVSFLGVPIILLFGYIYVKYSFKSLDSLERENRKYSLVQIQDRIEGVVLSVYSSGGNTFVKLNDSTKIWLEYSENDLYEIYLLWDLLQPNDSLVKLTNNDTLFIHRNNDIYYFKLGQRINKPIRNK